MNRIAAILCLVLLPMTAGAQNFDKRVLRYVDGDRNGEVPVAEFLNKMKPLFAELDANGNGRLEWEEARVTVTRDLFDQADTTGNGSIDKREFTDQVLRDFVRADLNADRVLK